MYSLIKQTLALTKTASVLENFLSYIIRSIFTINLDNLEKVRINIKQYKGCNRRFSREYNFEICLSTMKWMCSICFTFSSSIL